VAFQAAAAFKQAAMPSMGIPQRVHASPSSFVIMRKSRLGDAEQVLACQSFTALGAIDPFLRETEMLP